MMARLRRVRRSRAWRVVSWVVLALVAVPALLYLAPWVTGSSGAYLVLSGSMAPTFQPGDLAFVTPAEEHPLPMGSVVTFRVSAGALVTHRIVGISHEPDGAVLYKTRGDANDSPDPFDVRPEQVVGVYRFRIPWWGLLLQALRTQAGYVVLVLAPGVIILAREFLSLYKELDAADRERRRRREEATAMEAWLRGLEREMEAAR